MRLWSAARVVALGLCAWGCDEGAGLDCAADEDVIRGECVKVVNVKLNSVGFLPDRRKLATYSGGSAEFQVLRADGSVAHSGVASGPTPSPDTDEEVYVADFSELSEEGVFMVSVPGLGSSVNFTIAPGVFNEVFRANMVGLYGQRCGSAVSFTYAGETYGHDECHMTDASTGEFPDVAGPKSGTRGWHDAGDYGKYTNNGAFSLGMMFLAWEHYEPAISQFALDIPEAGGAIPDYLDECKWQLDWLLGMQFEDGSVSDRITTRNFDGLNVSPSGSVEVRRFSPVSTVAAADFIAATAMAARIYEPYDAELAAQYRDAAKLSYSYLKATPSPVSFDLDEKQYTGGYQSADNDDRLWAMVELWRTTGDAEILAELEARIPERVSVSATWDWPDMLNMAYVTYALSDSPDRDAAKVEAVKTAMITRADGLAAGAERDAYGRGVEGVYYWGINGVIARNVIVLMAAHRLAPDDKYLDASISQLDWLLGRNYFGRSQLTGVGHDPPHEPHHRPSISDAVGKPWPGLLIGGPWAREEGQLAATVWNDVSGDATTNEVAINWTAAMLYAIAPFM
jgi:endoglucanase